MTRCGPHDSRSRVVEFFDHIGSSEAKARIVAKYDKH